MSVELRGILNGETGRLVMTGAAETGLQVHVRGDVVASSAGVAALEGEVMFNPQPEPPAQ